MVERICPACRHANPLENRYCGGCGQALEQDALAVRPQTAITIAGQQLPAAQLRQVGRAVALGLAAVAAEAGLAWLRRRTGAPATTALAARPRSAPLAQPAADAASSVVTIVSQRVTEIWEEGSLTRQVVEKHIWRRTSE